jgi:hypothetical protein
MNENERQLIRLGLRALGGATKHRNMYKNDSERYIAASEELMGIWRAALVAGCYDATDEIDKMQDIAREIGFVLLGE